MGKHKHSSLPFELIGQFVGFIVKDGYKVKGLRLATDQGEISIKLSKEARASCFPLPPLGITLRIMGEQRIDEDGEVKFKAYQVIQLAEDVLASEGAIALPPRAPRPAAAPKTAAKACISICQKSDCCKRGGREVMAALQHELETRELTGQITLRGTGCMKQCKAGPALVMPDKTRHTRVRAEDVPQLLDRHAAGIEAPAIAS